MVSGIIKFLIVKNSKYGIIDSGEKIGKVVRFYWSKDVSTPLLIDNVNRSTGKLGKVAMSDGAKSIPDLPTELPNDIDYEKYIQHSMAKLKKLGV